MKRVLLILLLLLPLLGYTQNYRGGMVKTKTTICDEYLQITVFENWISINTDRYKILRELDTDKYYCINDSTSFTITIQKSVGPGSDLYSLVISVVPEDDPCHYIYYYVNRQVLSNIE